MNQNSRSISHIILVLVAGYSLLANPSAVLAKYRPIAPMPANDHTIEIEAKPGVPRIIARVPKFGRHGKCQAGALPQMAVVTPPIGGVLTTGTGPVTVGDGSLGDTTVCAGATINGLYVYYTANKSFKGVDQFQITFNLTMLNRWTYDLRVTVK